MSKILDFCTVIQPGQRSCKRQNSGMLPQSKAGRGALIWHPGTLVPLEARASASRATLLSFSAPISVGPACPSDGSAFPAPLASGAGSIDPSARRAAQEGRDLELVLLGRAMPTLSNTVGSAVLIVSATGEKAIGAERNSRRKRQELSEFTSLVFLLDLTLWNGPTATMSVSTRAALLFTSLSRGRSRPPLLCWTRRGRTCAGGRPRETARRRLSPSGSKFSTAPPTKCSPFWSSVPNAPPACASPALFVAS